MKMKMGFFLFILFNPRQSRVFINISAHTLARSLHNVSRANNNRFEVVVCFRLAFHASGMRIFLEIFVFKFKKFLYHYDDVIIR